MMASSAAAEVSRLPLSQIQLFGQKVEEEIQFFSVSLKNLKMLQQKFCEAQQCVKMFKEENTGKEVLVPMTATMYIPGVLCNADRALIDIGTGYYAEMVSTGILILCIKYHCLVLLQSCIKYCFNHD